MDWLLFGDVLWFVLYLWSRQSTALWTQVPSEPRLMSHPHFRRIRLEHVVSVSGKPRERQRAPADGFGVSE